MAFSIYQIIYLINLTFAKLELNIIPESWFSKNIENKRKLD